MEVKYCNVGYIYNKKISNEHSVLDDINLDFESGKVYAIVGKCGSGKTTLIELINGVLLPTSGHIDISSYRLEQNNKIKDINSLRNKIGLVFQFPEEQFFANTVEREIEFALNCFNYKKSGIEKRIKDALIMVGLDESFLKRDPLSLSHGEKRLVAIASILVFNPKVIVLDEPTIGLDYVSRKNLLKIIRMLKNRYGKTIIVVSHDTDFLLKISDEVIVLEDGRVVLKGNKYDVFSNEKIMKKNNIKVPDIIEFSNLVKKKKNIKIGYRDEINDLIKDIYRYVK